MKREVCRIIKKKRNKKMHTPRQKVIQNPIPTYLFLSRSQRRHFDVKVSLPNAIDKPHFSAQKDVGMGL